MQEQSRDLARQTALAALPWAIGLAVALTFTGIIPCCNLLVFPLAALGLGYLITPRLNLYVTPETKGSLALTIGLTIGGLTTVAATIAALITQVISVGFIALLGLSSSSRSNLSLLSGSLGFGISLIVTLIITVVASLIFGTLFAMLGSYLAFDRQRRPESYF